MSGLNQRLTLLRKQSGVVANDVMLGSKARISIVKNLLKEKNLTDKLRCATISTNNVNGINRTEKTTDQVIATLLQGQVLVPGLVSVTTTIALQTLHGDYDSTFSKRIDNLTDKKTDYIDKEQLLFLDTETTGLSTASGTRVFLLGVAEIIGDQLILQQLLLTQISAEAAMLKWFNQKLLSKSHLVSYNGKSFDVPLLVTRFRMLRMQSDVMDKQHIDLLHWIRRLHRTDMPDCRLPSAEVHCLGFKRKDDMPGSEAPFVWQALIRQGVTDQLPQLMQHHAWDIISLAGLSHYAEHLLTGNADETFNYAKIAQYYIKNGQTLRACKLLETYYSKLNTEALFLLSQIYRRQKKWDKSVIIWLVLKSENFLPAIESLAKYYEHKKKNYDKAISETHVLLSESADPRHNYRFVRLQYKIRGCALPHAVGVSSKEV